MSVGDPLPRFECAECGAIGTSPTHAPRCSHFMPFGECDPPEDGHSQETTDQARTDIESDETNA